MKNIYFFADEYCSFSSKTKCCIQQGFFIIIGFSTIYNFSTMSNMTFCISHGPDFIFPSAIQFCKIPNSLDFNTTEEWGNQEVKTY